MTTDLDLAGGHAGTASPTPAQFKYLRLCNGRTQAELAARLDVTERQVQRWEAGLSPVPSAYWQLLRRVWGYRFAVDFQQARDGMTRGWDVPRDAKRETIERGDVVELQAIGGPRLRATVCLDRVHDGAGEDGYAAFVTEFVGLEEGGPVEDEYDGFCLGERVSFARANIIHLEQRVPSAAARQGHHGQGQVLYVYRCPACRHRGEVHLPDDTHDGEATTCSVCGSPALLEWDGGVTLDVKGRP